MKNIIFSICAVLIISCAQLMGTSSDPSEDMIQHDILTLNTQIRNRILAAQILSIFEEREETKTNELEGRIIYTGGSRYVIDPLSTNYDYDSDTEDIPQLEFSDNEDSESD